MPNKSKTQKFFKKLKDSQRTDQYIPAVLGNRDGEVKGSKRGYVWVRLVNGQAMQLRNSKVPSIPRLPVLLGFEPTRPGLLQVLAARDIYADDAGFDLPSHGETHSWPEYDTVYVRDEQVLPLLVYPVGTWTVKARKKIVPWLDGQTYVEFKDQDVDLSAHVVSVGARWVLLQGDENGLVTAKEGASVVSKETLTPADIPAVDADHIAICAVQMYAGQKSLMKAKRRNDFVDLRSGIGRGLGTLEGVMLRSVYDLNNNGVVDDTEAIGGAAVQYPLEPSAGDLLRYNGTHFVPVDDTPRKWLKNTPPSVTNDSTEGYYKSDLWINQAADAAYVCVDNSKDAAIWLQVSGGGSGGQNYFAVDGVLAVVDNAPNVIVITADVEITSWVLYCKVTGSSSSTIVDINLVGTGSIFSSKPTLAYNDADHKVTQAATITEFHAGDILTLDIDQVAPGAAGLVIAGNGGGSGATTFNLIVDDGATEVQNVSRVNIVNATIADDGDGEATLTVPAQVPYMAWTTGTRTDGLSSNHNQGVQHYYQEQILVVVRPIKIMSVKWWIRTSKIYGMTIKEAHLSGSSASLFGTTATYDAGDNHHTFSLGGVILKPGAYAFRLYVDDDTVVDWEDSVTDEMRMICGAWHAGNPVIYGSGSNDQGSKDPTALAPIEITYYDSDFEVS